MNQEETPKPNTLLTCQICLKVLYNAVALDCSHNFCGSCISVYIKSIDEQNKKLVCPSCKQDVQLIKKNYPINE